MNGGNLQPEGIQGKAVGEALPAHQNRGAPEQRAAPESRAPDGVSSLYGLPDWRTKHPTL